MRVIPDPVVQAVNALRIQRIRSRVSDCGGSNTITSNRQGIFAHCGLRCRNSCAVRTMRCCLCMFTEPAALSNKRLLRALTSTKTSCAPSCAIISISPVLPLKLRSSKRRPWSSSRLTALSSQSSPRDFIVAVCLCALMWRVHSIYWAFRAPPSNVAADSSRWMRRFGSILSRPVCPRNRASAPLCRRIKFDCTRKASAPSALRRV
jgi:hypothetical protein